MSRKAAALGLEVPLSPCRAEGTGAELSLGGSFPFYSWPEPALCHFDTSGPRKPTGLAFEDICRDFENHPLALPRTSSCFCSLEPQRCRGLRSQEEGCAPEDRRAGQRLLSGIHSRVGLYPQLLLQRRQISKLEGRARSGPITRRLCALRGPQPHLVTEKNPVRLGDRRC